MAAAETISLSPRKHGKLGPLHCGVTRDGLVVVAGEQREIADGEQVRMERARVLVSRKGKEYIFTKDSS